MTNGSAILGRLEKTGRAAENALLVVILGAMILLAFAQIVLRNFLDIGFIWADELLRILVLWVAVAGAVAASRTNKHINIAVLDRFLPPRALNAAGVVVFLFTAGICGIVAWKSAGFVLSSRQFGDVLLGSVPAWLLQSVLPVGFALMAWRYLLFAVRDLLGLLRGEAGR